ncbi:hypothetical protein ACX27_27395 [Nostoc piscinale CENA21]|uniref:Uncharacterized protein n=1 Tax=Nostoc piscinale CENA21 TaxID=224013 RepID=A0A0M3V6J0_9NOSO|nr:hypothetical protein ACX27_27395 [Nostoc piscinale CENA21]
MTEHQYLRGLVADRFDAEYCAIAQSLSPRINQARLDGDVLQVELLKCKREFLFQQALLQKMRSEDIIYWLEQDNELRRLGANYVECHEAPSFT